MIRNLVCPKCSIHVPLPKDRMTGGFKFRRMELKVKTPDDLSGLSCDTCANPLPDGSDAVALTMYRGPEPELWELEYLAVTK